jgi:hypothetical protein
MTGSEGTAPGRTGRRRMRRPNQLRRTSDRIEAALTFALLMTMLLIAPWAAWSIAGQTYRDEVRADDWDRHHRFPVTAELLRDAPGLDGRTGDAMPAAATRGTLARWTGPDETVHTGLIAADFGSRQGATMSIWVDRQGALTGPPVRRNAVLDALMAALLTVGGIGSALYAAHRLTVWRLDRRRLRAWEQEWLVVEPGWTHR